MTKVCFFLPTLNFGGIEANTIRLAKSFSKSGYDTNLLVGNASGQYIKRINKDLDVITLNKKSLITMVYPLINYIKNEKPAVIITGGEGANIILSLTKIFYPKAKIIISIRTNLTVEYKESTNKKKRILFPLLSKILYKKADKIVTVSQGVANDASVFLNIPFERFNVIYNPILDNNLIELMNEDVHHRWLNNKKNRVILSVGRLVKQKDLYTLIKAFKIVKQNNSNAKLLIVGDGPEKENLLKEIKNNSLEFDIDIIGFVQNPYSYMKNANIFVLSSKWEGFGNVLVEALSTGTPIISTNCPSGPSEILDEGLYGKLVNVGDFESMANAILLELDNNIEESEMRINRAKQFSVEASKKRYIDLIKSI